MMHDTAAVGPFVPVRPGVRVQPFLHWGRTHWKALLAAVLGTTAVLVLGVPRIFGPVVQGVPVVRADLVQTLVASGHIETPNRVSVGAQVTGIVSAVPVAEGQWVHAGDTLLRLEATEAAGLALQARGQVAQADARARQIRELALPAAEAALAQARITRLGMQLALQRNLTGIGGESQAALDLARRNLDIADAAVRAAELAVATNRSGGSDAMLAAAQAVQARGNLAAATARTAYRVVTAPRDGVLIARAVEVGDVVTPGTTLMVLSPSGVVDVVVRVDEQNLRLLALGQPARVSADAYATDTLDAKVVYINPGIDLERASVAVRLRISQPPAYLRPDMTVSVDITVAHLPKVLLVPLQDVHDADTSPWVLTTSGGRAHRHAVTLGLVAGGHAEVRAGLTDGAMIVPRRAIAVRDGDAVRLRAPKDSS